MAVCTVSQGGAVTSAAETAELGSESNFVLVACALEDPRPELESDPNSATDFAVASAAAQSRPAQALQNTVPVRHETFQACRGAGRGGGCRR